MKAKKYLLFDPTSSEEGDQRIAIIVDQDIPKLTETVQTALREHYDEEVTVTKLSTDTRGYGKHHAYLVEAEMPMWDGWDKRGVFILTSICEYGGEEDSILHKALDRMVSGEPVELTEQFKSDRMEEESLSFGELTQIMENNLKNLWYILRITNEGNIDLISDSGVVFIDQPISSVKL